MMKKIFLFLVTIFNIVTLNAQTKEDLNYWNEVMEKIAKVESNKNPKVVNKIYVGYLQISPGVVKDVNEFIKQEKYTLDDRYDITKSKEMFVIYQKRYNKNKNIEKGIRIWNGGPSKYLNDKTLRYYKLVMQSDSL